MLRYSLGNTELGVGVEHERMDMASGRDQRQTAWTAAVTQRLGAWTIVCDFDATRATRRARASDQRWRRAARRVARCSAR